MRYHEIVFFDGVSIEESANTSKGYLEVDDNGNPVRLTDVDGNTLDDDTAPKGSYSTIGTKPVAPPSWAK